MTKALILDTKYANQKPKNNKKLILSNNWSNMTKPIGIESKQACIKVPQNHINVIPTIL